MRLKVIENKQINILEVKKSIAVDLPNYLFENKDSSGKAKMEYIDLLYEVLRNHDYDKIFLISSSSFINKVDEPEVYDKMVEMKKILRAPALVDNDWYVLAVAKELNCDILTNDKYKQYWGEFGKKWINKRRKTFMFVDGKLIIKE